MKNTNSFFEKQQDKKRNKGLLSKDRYKNGDIRLIPEGTKINGNIVTNRKGPITDGDINEKGKGIFSDSNIEANSILGITKNEAIRMRDTLENLFKSFNENAGTNKVIFNFINDNLKEDNDADYINHDFLLNNSIPSSAKMKNDDKFNDMKSFMFIISKAYKLISLVDSKSKIEDGSSKIKNSDLGFEFRNGYNEIDLFSIINAGKAYDKNEGTNNISTFNRTMNLALHGTANGVATKSADGKTTGY